MIELAAILAGVFGGAGTLFLLGHRISEGYWFWTPAPIEGQLWDLKGVGHVLVTQVRFTRTQVQVRYQIVDSPHATGPGTADVAHFLSYGTLLTTMPPELRELTAELKERKS